MRRGAAPFSVRGRQSLFQQDGYGAMADQKIDIGSYAGYQGEESPRVFFAHGEKITVLSILKMWIEEGETDRRQKRFFIAHGSDGFDHTLYFDLESGVWFYRGFEKAKRRC
jgi:uncharacterized protein YifE (UPF0438 family)